MAPSSVGATVYLIFIQVASRALTFVGNQVLLRYLSPTLLGIAVQLELLSVTILYFARESLRVALQRQPQPVAPSEKEGKQPHVSERAQATVNLSYLAIAFGLIIALVLGSWYLHVADHNVVESPHFRHAFLIYALATIIELSAEPSFLVIQQNALYSARARAETIAAIARCIAACAGAVVSRKADYPPSVLPFAIGQLSYACALYTFYYMAAAHASRQQGFRLLLTRLMGPDHLWSLFSKSPLALAGTMYLQSIFKLVLTQGDALILSVLSSLADQGAFALAANYGGLLARLVFQPIEESSRNTFGRLLGSTPYTQPSTSNSKAALTHLSSLVHFYLLATLPLITLAPPLVPLLTPYLFSSAFRTPAIASLLATYIYYIPFMAVNGILDAFVTSVATPAQLRRQSVWMALFTALYGVAAWFLLEKLELGAQGLVWANIVNMTLRIIWSGWFVRNWIWEQDDGDSLFSIWGEAMPHWGVNLAALWAIAARSWYGLDRGLQLKDGSIDLNKAGVWVAQVALFAGAILVFERDFLISIIHTIVPERLASKIPLFRRTAATPATDKKHL